MGENIQAFYVSYQKNCMAWMIDPLKVTKYFSSSTACCVLSAVLPFPLSTRRVFTCVTIESCTLVRHLESLAAWFHITDCSLADLSQRLRVSWLMVQEAGAEGKLCLATLVKALFNLAGSGDQ